MSSQIKEVNQSLTCNRGKEADNKSYICEMESESKIHFKLVITMPSISNRFKRTSVAVSTGRLILHIELGLFPSAGSVLDTIFT